MNEKNLTTPNHFFHPNELFQTAGKILGERYELREIQVTAISGIFCHSYDKIEERELTLKIFPQLISEDKKCLDKLRIETKRSFKLSHPNIWRVYSFEFEKDLPYLRLEPLPNKTLTSIIGRKNSPNIIINIFLQCIRALKYSHDKEMLHGDISPASILIDNKNNVKMIDFGVSNVVTDTLTRITGIHPKNANLYSAPEIIQGKFYGSETEFYSLSCVMYELMTKLPPFYTGDLAHQHIKEEPVQLPNDYKKIYGNLYDFVMVGLTKDPKKRKEGLDKIIGDIENETKPCIKSSEISINGKQKGKRKIIKTISISVVAIVLAFIIGVRIGSIFESYKNNHLLTSLNMNDGWAFIPGGKFFMGDKLADTEADNPYHPVILTRQYYIGKYEISNEQFIIYLNLNNETKLSNYPNINYENGLYRVKDLIYEKDPITGVPWEEARKFCLWLSSIDDKYNYRLPTEAEWELAARGGLEQQFFPWGAEFPAVDNPRLNSEQFDNYDGLCPVDIYEQNRNGYNYSGNAAEWVSDFYAENYYRNKNSTTDPKGPSSGTEHIVRGGSYLSPPKECGVAVRKKKSDYKSKEIGFRIVRIVK